jgi:multidrug efflux system membrane fusion protein
VFERTALKSFATTGDFGNLVSAISSPEFTLTTPPTAEQLKPDDTADVTLAAMTSDSGEAVTTDLEAQSGRPIGAGTDSADQSALAPLQTAGITGAKLGPVKVVAQQSEARLVDTAVVLRGRTEAARQVDVMAETSGKVVSVPLRKGRMVSEGQELCKLDPGTRMATLADARARLAEASARVPEARARQDEAQARLDEAKINNNAALKLSQGGYATETRVATTQAGVRAGEASVQAAKSGLESARAGIQSAEAGVAAVEREIEQLTITAPFDGLLETDTAEFGSLMQANGPAGGHCATIIQLDPLKLVGYVPETEVNKVVIGAKAGARLAAGGEAVTGQVTFISRSADAKTRTFRIEIQVPNTDLSLRDGQTAEILIASDGAKAHLLPQSALTLNDDGKLGVRIVDANSRAQFRAVKLLRDTPKGVLLTGLAQSATVIVIGQEYVIDDVDVAVTLSEIAQ